MANSFTIKNTKVELLSINLDTLEIEKINEQIEKRSIFQNETTHFILDFNNLPENEINSQISLDQIIKCFEKNNIKILAIRSRYNKIIEQAKKLKIHYIDSSINNFSKYKITNYQLATHNSTINPRKIEKKQTVKPVEEIQIKYFRNLQNFKPTKLVRNTVRSGQVIRAEGQSIVILQNVSPGADVIADGDIHVKGTVYGRIMAGASGEKKALIFIDDLKAHLVGIAGFYRNITDSEVERFKNKRVCILLKESKNEKGQLKHEVEMIALDENKGEKN